VRCFGANPFGQLGGGHADEWAAISHGFVDLGTTHVGANFHMGDKSHPNHVAPGFQIPVRLQMVKASHSHACALTCEGLVKCWGANYMGQLGYGDTMNRGFTHAEMGDNLPYVKLGHDPWINTPSGRGHFAHAQVVQIAVGGGTCSPHEWPAEPMGRTYTVDSNLELRGWGDNSCGYLPHPPASGVCAKRLNAHNELAAGRHHPCAAIGDQPWEMDHNLPIIKLHHDTKFTYAISVGTTFACAISASNDAPTAMWTPEENAARGGGLLKCWGDNSFGQLGQGNHKPVKFWLDKPPGDPDFVDWVKLPGKALQVSAGFAHACAAVLAESGEVKLYCWGENGGGQLFLTPAADDFSYVGDDPAEMGSAMRAVPKPARALRAPGVSGFTSIDESFVAPAIIAGNKNPTSCPENGAPTCVMGAAGPDDAVCVGAHTSFSPAALPAPLGKGINLRMASGKGGSDKCLSAVRGAPNTHKVVYAACDPLEPRQLWTLDSEQSVYVSLFHGAANLCLSTAKDAKTHADAFTLEPCAQAHKLDLAVGRQVPYCQKPHAQHPAAVGTIEIETALCFEAIKGDFTCERRLCTDAPFYNCDAIPDPAPPPSPAPLSPPPAPPAEHQCDRLHPAPHCNSKFFRAVLRKVKKQSLPAECNCNNDATAECEWEQYNSFGCQLAMRRDPYLRWECLAHALTPVARFMNKDCLHNWHPFEQNRPDAAQLAKCAAMEYPTSLMHSESCSEDARDCCLEFVECTLDQSETGGNHPVRARGAVCALLCARVCA
jgi:hypothetical protein